MNYGSETTERELEEAKNAKKKKERKRHPVLNVIGWIVFVFFALIIIAGALAAGCIKGIIDEGPSIDEISVSAEGYYTTVYDSQGNEIQTLLQAGSNRTYVSYEEVPDYVVDAFVAIEDSSFWEHPGIDPHGILRAIRGILQGDEVTSGASTITQQLIKNNVFGGGMEESWGDKLVRKIQEQWLALQLTDIMSKEEVMENYLNTINLSHNTLGIGTAAERYFGKEVGDLTLSEATVIAAITSNPSRWDPINHPDENARRRRIVLDYMVEQGYITEAQEEEALADNVYMRIAAHNGRYLEEETGVYSAFVDSLVTQVMEDLQEYCGYSEAQARNMLYSGGLSIYATQDPDCQAVVDAQINDLNNYGPQEFGITSYALSVQDANGEVTNWSEGHIKLTLGLEDLVFNSEEEAQAAIEAFKAEVVGPNDEIIGERADITLQPQVSFVLMDQSNGHVLALSNGRGEKTTSLSLQRATSSTRQPGSVFKVVSSFAPAMEATRATLATVFYDAPFVYNGKNIGNWWGGTYTGFSNIRQGITFSMNVVAARCLIERVSPLLGMQFCERFGITTLVEEETLADGTELTDLTASMALGGLTHGVKNIEITGAYAAIANGGVYNEPLLYTRIEDRMGNVLIDREEEQDTHRVLSEENAWLLTDAMEDSTEPHAYFTLGIGSTSTRAHIDGMSTAGKSGTTQDSNDQWFVGYTPYYTGGIWIGYDDNGTLSGADPIIKNIWHNIMQELTVGRGLPDLDFPMPSTITMATICARCGNLAVGGLCDHDPRPGVVYTEYFAPGTIPTQTCTCHVQAEVCTVSGLRPSEDCETREVRTFMNPSVAGGGTYDSGLLPPGEVCTVCTEAREAAESAAAEEEESRAAEEAAEGGSGGSDNSGGGSE